MLLEVDEGGYVTPPTQKQKLGDTFWAGEAEHTLGREFGRAATTVGPDKIHCALHRQSRVLLVEKKDGEYIVLSSLLLTHIAKALLYAKPPEADRDEEGITAKLKVKDGSALLRVFSGSTVVTESRLKEVCEKFDLRLAFLDKGLKQTDKETFSKVNPKNVKFLIHEQYWQTLRANLSQITSNLYTAPRMWASSSSLREITLAHTNDTELFGKNAFSHMPSLTKVGCKDAQTLDALCRCPHLDTLFYRTDAVLDLTNFSFKNEDGDSFKCRYQASPFEIGLETAQLKLRQRGNHRQQVLVWNHGYEDVYADRVLLSADTVWWLWGCKSSTKGVVTTELADIPPVVNAGAACHSIVLADGSFPGSNAVAQISISSRDDLKLNLATSGAANLRALYVKGDPLKQLAVTPFNALRHLVDVTIIWESWKQTFTNKTGFVNLGGLNSLTLKGQELDMQSNAICACPALEHVEVFETGKPKRVEPNLGWPVNNFRGCGKARFVVTLADDSIASVVASAYLFDAFEAQDRDVQQTGSEGQPSWGASFLARNNERSKLKITGKVLVLPYAFQGAMLSEVTLPNDAQLSDHAFDACINLQHVTLTGTVNAAPLSWNKPGWPAFSNCTRAQLHITVQCKVTQNLDVPDAFFTAVLHVPCLYSGTDHERVVNGILSALYAQHSGFESKQCTMGGQQLDVPMVTTENHGHVVRGQHAWYKDTNKFSARLLKGQIALETIKVYYNS